MRIIFQESCWAWPPRVSPQVVIGFRLSPLIEQPQQAITYLLQLVAFYHMQENTTVQFYSARNNRGPNPQTSHCYMQSIFIANLQPSHCYMQSTFIANLYTSHCYMQSLFTQMSFFIKSYVAFRISDAATPTHFSLRSSNYLLKVTLCLSCTSTDVSENTVLCNRLWQYNILDGPSCVDVITHIVCFRYKFGLPKTNLRVEKQL